MFILRINICFNVYIAYYFGLMFVLNTSIKTSTRSPDEHYRW